MEYIFLIIILSFLLIHYIIFFHLKIQGKSPGLLLDIRKKDGEKISSHIVDTLNYENKHINDIIMFFDGYILLEKKGEYVIDTDYIGNYMVEFNKRILWTNNKKKYINIIKPGYYKINVIFAGEKQNSKFIMKFIHSKTGKIMEKYYH